MKPILFASVLLTAAAAAAPQEPGGIETTARDSIRREYFVPATGPALPGVWRFDPATLRMVRTDDRPDRPMSPWAREQLPAHVYVLGDNTLRLGPRLILSNGQASNWGPLPDARLDARTLTFPGR